MDEMLLDNATTGADDLTAALRAQRDRAHQFFSRFRGSSENIEQQLLAQVDGALKHISQLQEGDAPSDEEWQRRQAALVEHELRVQQLQGNLAQRESRLGELQEELNRAHESLLAELTRSRETAAATAGPSLDAAVQLEQQLAQRQSQLAELVEHLAARHAAIEQAQVKLEAAQSQLETRRGDLDALLADLQAKQARLHDDRQQHEVAAAELNERAQEVNQQSHLVEKHSRQLDERLRELESREAELASARKQLARDLRLKRAEQLIEIEQRQADLEKLSAADDAELEGQLAQFTEELSRVRQQTHERGEQVDRLRQDLENARVQLVRRDAENRELSLRLEQIVSTNSHNSTETAALGAQLAEARERAESQHAAAHIALAQAREDYDQLRSELSQAHKLYDGAREKIAQLEDEAAQLRRRLEKSGDDASSLRIKELEHERDALVERLSDAEQITSLSSGGASEESDELRRRFEMALDDVRTLKTRNAELEEKLAHAPRGSGGGKPSSDGKMDWESQKQRMLAQLEADFDPNDPQEAKDKMTVEGAIHITDGIVGQKDREIEELQRLLDEQSKNIGGVAVGAAAIAQLLDSDELIRSEREKIEALQNEWREKLRKAEIDISVERAKIARDRAQLEEKLQTMASRDGEAANTDDSGKKKKGSRWLSRLGLSEDEKK